jgi:hypothetical protein
MAYENNRGYSNRGYSNNYQQERRGGEGTGYSNSYQPRNNYQQRGSYTAGGGQQRSAPKKHSGCKQVVMQRGGNSGETCLVVWNFSKRRGMISGIITPYKGTKTSTSKNGRVWENWFCTLDYKDSGQQRKCSALVDPSTGKAIVKELGMIANPRAKNGGYFGTFTNNG